MENNISKLWKTEDWLACWLGFISRGGFSIHGGFEPGSSGCIDLHKNAPAFFKAISNAKANQITLYVCYKK